jgi:phenylalanyl-tRNA synthetase beta chain
MPVLRFKPGRVEEVLGLPLSEALKVMERLKIEVEIDNEGYVVAELEVDRPDMYSLEGIARQVKGLLGKELGIPRYNTVSTEYTIIADNVPTRPYIVGLIVWDVNIDEDYLVELIQFQEKLTASHGLNRRRIAIGIHDLDKMPSNKLFYRFEPIDTVKFKPLHHDKTMTLAEVLTVTEQGKKYGSISLSEGKHPVLYAGKEVISVPPVINADITRVEPGTRHVFIDITGTELKPVLDAAAIFAANLAERSMSKNIGLVRVEAPWGKLVEPRLEPAPMTVSIEKINNLLGVSIDSSEAVKLLRRMRFEANALTETSLEVLVPRYRIDILHEVDIAEEIMLAIGLENIEPIKPSRMLRGSLFVTRYWEREARQILAGYGFVEVKNYTLSSCKDQVEIAGASPDELVYISNPVSVELDCYRYSLAPLLLRTLAQNQHRVPVKIFEVGEAVKRVKRVENGEPPVLLRKLLAVAIMGEKIGYEDIQAVVYGLVELLSDKIENINRIEKKLFIKGRAAKVLTKNGLEIELGEINPEILEKLEIKYPVAFAEIDYTKLHEKGIVKRGGAAVPRP